MRIKVLPKITFNQYLTCLEITDDNVVELFPDTFFISINNTIHVEENNAGYFFKDHSNVLTLYFDDVSQDLYDIIKYDNGEPNKIDYTHCKAKAITESQVRHIVDFVDNQKKSNKTKCWVHCSAGISRSGAVGAFINDYFGESYDTFKRDNPHVCENRYISMLLNREWYKRNC